MQGPVGARPYLTKNLPLISDYQKDRQKGGCHKCFNIIFRIRMSLFLSIIFWCMYDVCSV